MKLVFQGEERVNDKYIKYFFHVLSEPQGVQ